MRLSCDNMSAINISKNLIQHSCSKHIYIRHYFIRELVEDKFITLDHVSTGKTIVNIFIKALNATQSEKLRNALRMFVMDIL